MQSLTIIKHDQVINHAQRGLGPGVGWVLREAFFFQTPKHPFYDGIIITVALPTHTAHHLGIPALLLILRTGILTAAIRMMQQARRGLALSDGHVQGLRHSTRRHGGRTGPAHDFAGKQIDHNGDVQPPFLGPKSRDVTAPHPIGRCDRKLLVQLDWAQWAKHGDYPSSAGIAMCAWASGSPDASASVSDSDRLHTRPPARPHSIGGSHSYDERPGGGAESW